MHCDDSGADPKCAECRSAHILQATPQTGSTAAACLVRSCELVILSCEHIVTSYSVATRRSANGCRYTKHDGDEVFNTLLFGLGLRRSLRPAGSNKKGEIMKKVVLLAALGSMLLAGAALAETVGSVEPIIDNGVIETGALTGQELDVRAAFAERLFHCGIVDVVERLLSLERVTTTLDDRNTRFRVSAGGFQGRTNPTFAFSAIDSGPNAASHADLQALTDSLGFVMTQDSVFLLDEDRTSSFDFPANYLVLNFCRTPPIEESAALFETVGRIDPSLFATDTSGYTQVGRSYISLQSDVPDEEFIAGYVQAAREFGVEYTPIIEGKPSLFRGSAAFPGNDWVAHPQGEEYLARLPGRVHEALRQIREFHLRFTLRAVRKLTRADVDHREARRVARHLDCR